MNKVLEEKKKLIMELWRKSIELINRDVDLGKFKRDFFPDEDRTLWVELEGLEELNTGYTVKDGKLVIIDKKIDKPTIIIRTTEDVLLAIAFGELTLMEAFMYEYLEVEGEHYMRDLTIFQHMLDKYGYLRKKLTEGGGNGTGKV